MSPSPGLPRLRRAAIVANGPTTVVPAIVLAVAGVALLASSVLRWVRPLSHDEECGWTCYVELPLGPPVHEFAGGWGWGASPVRQLVGVAVAGLAITLALRLLRRPVGAAPWAVLALGAAGAALVDLRFATDAFDESNVARMSGELQAVTTGVGPVTAAAAAGVLAVAGLALAAGGLLRRAPSRHGGH